MKITWLGQAGLLFEVDEKRIVVDPYLSDNVKNYEPVNYRRIPVDEAFLQIKPDIIVITHNHLDHLDKETLKYYLTDETGALVLAPNGAWQETRKFGGENNYVLFNDGTTWSEGDITFRAVKAEHSDPYALGLILSAEGKNYYVTGDTLYHEQVFCSLPTTDIYALFLPINGKGNNMNMQDAERFAVRISAKFVVPIHFGMFDELNGAEFNVANKVIPIIYQEIKI